MANNYTTIKTKAGLAIEAAAQATGDKIALTQMAIGDGGGNPVVPDAGQTALVREQVRVSLNAIAVDPSNAAQFTAEAILPAASGGFTMREAGLYTADGTLFAVANLPQVYKPSSSEGSFGQVVITMTFQASNADEVNLNIEENVSVATRLWVENYVVPEHVFKGGTAGQILAKSANDDGAWTWVDPSASVQILVDTVEEDQILAAGQTAIALSKVTANGLGVFVNGVRLRDDEWTKVDNTHISLNSARNDGDKITLLQNEQTGYSDVLRAARNLSDVDDADASLANLSGLSTKGGRVEGLFAVDSGAVYVNGSGSSTRQVVFQTDKKNRFSIEADAGAETGDNAGSAFRVLRFADDGTFIDAPLVIDRATGGISIAGGLVIGGVPAAGDRSNSAATTAFVQDAADKIAKTVSSEATSRSNADQGLQTQIDGKVSNNAGTDGGVVALDLDRDGTGRLIFLDKSGNWRTVQLAGDYATNTDLNNVSGVASNALQTANQGVSAAGTTQKTANNAAETANAAVSGGSTDGSNRRGVALYMAPNGNPSFAYDGGSTQVALLGQLVDDGNFRIVSGNIGRAHQGDYIAFSTAFSSAPVVIINSINNSDINCHPYNISNAGFYYHGNAGSASDINYFAYGPK